MTANQPTEGSRQKSRLAWVRYLFLIVFIALVVGAIGGYTFYEREVRAYWHQKGWKKKAASAVVLRFIESVKSQNFNEAVACVDAGSFEPLSEDNKVVGLQHKDPSGMGRYMLYFDKLIPAGNATIESVKFQATNQGGFSVLVRFGDGETGDFFVRRIGQDYKIVSLPMQAARFR
ncbi:MAG: hypothetical protein NZT92_04420 [Abditibacteriales bacterium]|nr:hypothetical protein [Abditibacteriales bacterium]MDW8364508.1 hypothetical protein [Abditibacteriales bacterium]